MVSLAKINPTMTSMIFTKILMSNTLVYSSPVGQAYFSIFGDRFLQKYYKEIPINTIKIIRFYKKKAESKQKEQKKVKKEKKDLSNLDTQFWSTFILLIIQEYTMDRTHREDISGYRDTLCNAELANIPPKKIDNYITCSKIMMSAIEYIKAISNPKVKKDETLLFIALMIKMCGIDNKKQYLECILCILRFRNAFNKTQMKSIHKFLIKVIGEIQDEDIKRILKVLADEINLLKDDDFGNIANKEELKQDESADEEENSKSQSQEEEKEHSLTDSKPTSNAITQSSIQSHDSQSEINTISSNKKPENDASDSESVIVTTNVGKKLKKKKLISRQDQDVFYPKMKA